jgi:hypothetical protein
VLLKPSLSPSFYWSSANPAGAPSIAEPSPGPDDSGVEFSTALVEHARALGAADAYHVVADFMADDNEAGIAKNQVAQAKSASGANRNKQKGNTI